MFHSLCSALSTVTDAIVNVCDLTRPTEICTSAVNNVSVWVGVDRWIKEKGVLTRGTARVMIRCISTGHQTGFIARIN